MQLHRNNQKAPMLIFVATYPMCKFYNVRIFSNLHFRTTAYKPNIAWFVWGLASSEWLGIFGFSWSMADVEIEEIDCWRNPFGPFGDASK